MTKKLNPWNISLKKRIECLDSSKSNNRITIALIYPSPDASTFRYRGYNYFSASKASKKCQLIYFFLPEIEAVKNLLNQGKIDILIFSRIKPWSYDLDNLSIVAHERRIPVLNDLDDCICGQKHIKSMFNSVAPDMTDISYWINASAHFELIAQLCDGFITTNEYLGKILASSHDGKPYYVVPNTLNQEQIDYSRFLVRKKENTGKKDKFTVGYFSGSATHAADLEVIYPELLDLLTNHDDIKLRIVGKMELPRETSRFIKSEQIELYPIVDYLELQRLVSEVDVNLAPLQENVFTNCKSELKFFESAIVKTPTIASPTFSFRNAIKNNQTGFLCHPGEWSDVILKLKSDSMLKKQIADNASDYCLTHYSPTASNNYLEKAVSNILKI